MPTANPGSFIPYDSITFDIAVEWVTSVLNASALNVAAYQTILSNQINQQLNPTVVVGLPPFSG
jgi:hypothetical protein